MTGHARSTLLKVLLSVSAIGAAAGIAGLGTFGSFSSTTSASQSVGAGRVVITLGATGAATNRLTVDAVGIVPGDTMQRSFDLVNSGDQALASISLTTTAATSSLLDQDATNGLQMTIDRCSVPWTESGATPAFTYSCSGTVANALPTRPVITTTAPLAGMAALSPGGTDHYRLTLTFPTSAPNSMQGLTSVIQYSLTGTQRAGGAR
jgi:spore coat-associated protein N